MKTEIGMHMTEMNKTNHRNPHQSITRLHTTINTKK